jgi:Zn-finger protein
MKSILQDEKQCFFCHSTMNLELHHAIHGVANRKIADREGLTVFLCHGCHARVHDSDREMDLVLIKTAQRAYESRHSREEWMALFSHNWLWDEE